MKKPNKICFVIFTFFVLIVTLLKAESGEEHSIAPVEGFVPNSKTAISIARAVWIPIYGETQINKQKPYQVVLENKKWIIKGSLPKGVPGGVAYAEIAKKDGRILRVTHSR